VVSIDRLKPAFILQDDEEELLPQKTAHRAMGQECQKTEDPGLEEIPPSTRNDNVPVKTRAGRRVPFPKKYLETFISK